MALTEVLFESGDVRLLPGVAEALKESGEDHRSFIDRHVRGDWGNSQTMREPQTPLPLRSEANFSPVTERRLARRSLS